MKNNSVKLQKAIEYCNAKIKENRRNDRVARKYEIVCDFAVRDQYLENGEAYFLEYLESELKPGNNQPGTLMHTIVTEVMSAIN